MELKNERESLKSDEKIAYRITFSRLNRITLLTGLTFFIFAIINIPFLYNPEIEEITTDLTGKPTMGPLAAIRAYVWIGLIPLFLGVIFILFSLFSARKVILILYKNGNCRYIKQGLSNFLLDTQVDFLLKSNLQQISLGKRHQRFVMWVSVAVLMFIIFMLIDYINFLDLTFDITFMFFDTELSLKMILILNIILMISIMMPYILFPRKLCRIDTSQEFIQFDYYSLEVETLIECSNELPYIDAFKLLCKSNREIEKEKPPKSEYPDNYPQILKEQINNQNFNHVPLFSLMMNIGFLLTILLPLLIPNYFLGGFTFRIEYFLSIAIFFLIVRTSQNSWFTNQRINTYNNQKDLLLYRKNPVFGELVEYFSETDKIKHIYTARKPHFLEYTIFLIPIIEVIWVLFFMYSHAEYYFTENIYTIIYLMVIIGIFYFIVSEYVFPKSALKITPKQQLERKKVESFLVYFPGEKILKAPPFKEAIKSAEGIKNILAGILIILIPVTLGLIWVILSSYGIIPSLDGTIF